MGSEKTQVVQMGQQGGDRVVEEIWAAFWSLVVSRESRKLRDIMEERLPSKGKRWRLYIM